MYAFGPFAIDPDRRLLTRDGQPVPITARAFDVLLALVQRAGETLDKSELLRAVWPDTVVEEANLSQQIFTLRKTLGQSDTEVFIATVPRRGYRWVAPLHGRHDAGLDHQRPAPLPRASRPIACLEIALAAALPESSSTVIAISPDGSRVVYVGTEGTVTRLYSRWIDSFDSTPIAGTDGAVNPFFSPDGQWIGFQSARRLVKLSLDGGPPIALCEVAELRGATWNAAGDIIYAPGPTTGLWLVSERGGAPRPLTRVDFDSGERTHRWPHALPDGRVIFTIGRAGAASFDEATLAVTQPAGRHRVLLQHATDGRWLSDGHLAWARGGTLFAAAFAAEHDRISGPPRVVQHGVAMSATGVAHFASSDTGTLVHIAGAAQSARRTLVSVDRSGVEIARHMSGEWLEEPRIAPHGRAALVSLRSHSSDLWSCDFISRAVTRLTFDGENFAGIWGPDPDTITFSTSTGGPSDLFLLRPDRTVPPELLVSSEFDKVPGAWSPDGGTLVFTEYHPDTGADIWLLERSCERVRPFVVTRFNEYAATFSPDGRYIAYVTDESGRPEVMVVSFPDATGKRQLSLDGGTEPMWGRDGSEIFYRSGDRLMRVDVGRGVEHAGIPTTLFEGGFARGTVTLANYDTWPDRPEFLMVLPDTTPLPRTLRVTVGWTAAGADVPPQR